MTTTFLGLCAVAFSALCFFAARKMKGYEQGFHAGEKAGYAQGFEEGRRVADNWWMGLERETARTKQQMQDEERWP